ncbi:hypothetical protein JX266_006168 [Neoarthrinium moseri]|nr:hypothetical protein JX266_006168 [Neoarthrinium moseri]
MPNLDPLTPKLLEPHNEKEPEVEYYQIPHESIDDIEEAVPKNDAGQAPSWAQPNGGRSHRLWVLAPWFLAAMCGKATRKQSKVTSTTYMNGIRGLACIIVYSFHVVSYYYQAFANPWGAAPAELNYGISQLPFVRIVLAGKAMVCLFFVLSGFVLAYSPLRTISARLSNSSSNTRSSDDLIGKLCSSMVRRGIRLFMPLIVLASITCIVTWYYPIFPPGTWRDNNQTFWGHIMGYVSLTLPVMDPYLWSVYAPTSFNHCWTLGVEYRGSMIIFMLCVAVADLGKRCRKLVIAVSALWALHFGHWEVFCFMAGMFLAELRFNPLSEDFAFLTSNRRSWQPAPIEDLGLESSVRDRRHRLFKTAFFSGLLVFAIFVMGWPQGGHQGVEPYNTLVGLVPILYQGNNDATVCFWGSVGGFLLLVACENLPWVQWLLSTPPMIYLGDISFSFYLLHWLIYLAPGVEILKLFGDFGWSTDASFYTMYVIVFAMIVVVADYYWRLVDEPSVALGRILFNKVKAQKDEE